MLRNFVAVTRIISEFVCKMTSVSPRIVEVNGANVNQENHKQVVTRIKSIENETKLLGGN